MGIYQTDNAYKDAGAVIKQDDTQEALGKPRQVSLFYFQHKDPKLEERLKYRGERPWKGLNLGHSRAHPRNMPTASDGLCDAA